MRLRPAVVVASLAAVVLLTAGCGGGAGPAAGSASAAGSSADGSGEPLASVSLLPTETTVTAPPETTDDTTGGSGSPSGPAPVDGQSATSLDQALEQALAATTETLVTDALGAQGITLASGPKCTAALTPKGSGPTASGTVTCIGTSDTGRAVDSTFDGTVTAGGACEGRLVVRVGGTIVVQRQVTECGVDVP